LNKNFQHIVTDSTAAVNTHRDII